MAEKTGLHMKLSIVWIAAYTLRLGQRKVSRIRREWILAVPQSELQFVLFTCDTQIIPTAWLASQNGYEGQGRRHRWRLCKSQSTLQIQSDRLHPHHHYGTHLRAYHSEAKSKYQSEFIKFLEENRECILSEYFNGLVFLKQTLREVSMNNFMKMS